MVETVKACPLCGSGNHSLFDQRHFRGQPVTNVICSSCGLVFQSPRLTAAESEAFYQAEYRQLYQGQEGPNPKDLAVQVARARATLDFIRQWVRTAPRILDIGCSTGVLLKQWQDFYQAQVFGIEPGNIYREYAQSSGLDVYASLEELQSGASSRFSLVSMMHVLEHLTDPLAYLQGLREERIEPHGWLLLEVPNLYAHDCFEVAHMLSFSAHTLTKLVQKAGYKVVRLQAHGSPRSELIPLYLTMLAQPDDQLQYRFAPERLVRIRRQWGFLRRRFVERLFPQRAWIPISSLNPE